MAEIEPVRIISDNPEKDSVAFGFDAYAWTIADLISNKEKFWGQGKFWGHNTRAAGQVSCPQNTPVRNTPDPNDYLRLFKEL